MPKRYTKPRANGSRRKPQGTRTPIKRWTYEGIKIGSVSIRGLTLLKLFLVLEIEDLDVICVQETWMEAGAQVPAIPGFKVLEQRRIEGTRGGLATYFRQSLRLEFTMGNKYGLYTKLVLPTSQRVNITNVFLPPTSSLRRRDITEAQAVAKLEMVMEQLQP